MIAITPKPEPPDVTTLLSPLLLSLANPLTGCAKSQKYLKVCFCTSSTNAESLICGNLSEESIAVLKLMSMPATNFPPCDDCRLLDKEILYVVRGTKGADGETNRVLSPLE